MSKKILSTVIMVMMVLNVTAIADDKIEEKNNKEAKNVIETTANVSEAPKINSRAAVVIDRKSKTILYGKNENTKKAMA